MEISNTAQMTLIELYQHMIASRESDLIESELVNSGEANFLASSKGHEGSVILAPFLHPSDWLHCHYRDKALMLARGIKSEMFFYSALAKAESHSNGRQMVSHMSAAELNIMSIVGPVGNNALQAAGVAHAIKNQPDNPIVVCSMGDGTSQQGEVLEAIAEAKRSNLPLLFFIHNNNLAISTRTTGQTFFSLPNEVLADSFYAIPITYLEGTRPLEQLATVKQIITTMRHDRGPQIIVFNLDRLDNHSNADDQKLYRTSEELSQSKSNDPLTFSRDYLLEQGIDRLTLINVEQSTVALIRGALNKARQGTEPAVCIDAEKPLSEDLQANAREYRGDFSAENRFTMLEAMRQVFYDQLKHDKNVYLLGQDIEDEKGDVFGITRGLSTAFPQQVKNSPLSESTIVGVAGGMALAGKRPVAFIQFADFMPLAYNQIFSELATMYWRTNGQWQCPVIVFAACGGYRPGLGPFHSQTNEATYAHIPGIDVYMPSTAADAAGMLNAAFKSGRPSVFLYPKKLLNNGSIADTSSTDTNKHLIPIGKARIVKSGEDITLVAWGNTVSLCQQVADSLETVGVEAEIIDLRTIKPFDLTSIIASVEKTQHLIVTHEDNITCGVGGEIIASVVERANGSIKARRVARPDTYTPCNYANQLDVLPSYEKILTAAAELLNLSLSWQVESALDESVHRVAVIGASPSDESVLITSIRVKVGDEVKPSDTLVDIEASKAAGEILSPCHGYIEEIQVTEGERAMVGGALLTIRLAQGQSRLLQKQTKKAILKRPLAQQRPPLSQQLISQILPVGICRPHFKTGSRQVSNSELLQEFTSYSHADIVKRTGIENRYWLAEDESIVDIAVEVIIAALKAEHLKLADINVIICATCTPEQYQSPAMACLILAKLYSVYGEQAIPAYDINAACSGYLYALQNAKDYLQTRPNERVLVVTAEALSRRMNLSDFDTAFLFGDAATATVVCGRDFIQQSYAVLDQVYLSAIGESGEVLNIPVAETEGIVLQGKKLFTLAVKTMAMVMHKCCQKEGIELTSINLVVPHQANQRILGAVESRLGLNPGTLYSNIAQYGNTSSCTIPIALAETLSNLTPNQRVALCAFGGGFTAGAALLTIR